MPRGGNNALPNELKVLKGTFRPSRAKRAGKPELPLAAPPCPVWLSPIARTEWKRIVPELLRAGLLSRVDQAALATYCENYAQIAQCAAAIRRAGGYAKYLKGKNSQTAPMIIVMNKASAMVRAFCAEFGMTPSSRGRMVVSAPGEGSGEPEDLD